MNYNLNDISVKQEKASNLRILQNLLQLIKEERKNLFLACLAILTNSGLTLLSPYIIGHTIDKYVMHKDYHGVLMNAGLACLHCIGCIWRQLYANKNDGWNKSADVIQTAQYGFQ